jgi:hypothetical protein
MTQSDMSLEWHTYVSLVALVHFEDRKPGLVVALAAQEYGLDMREATALIQSLRDVGEKTDKLMPRVSICSAGISSAQAYVDWWARYEEEVNSYRLATIGALAKTIDSSIWEAAVAQKYLPWLRGDGLGDRISFRKQVAVADYAIWLRDGAEADHLSSQEVTAAARLRRTKQCSSTTAASRTLRSSASDRIRSIDCGANGH